MQDDFEGLFQQNSVELPPETKDDRSGRDSKRHEPHQPKYGRQYDRKSVKGEKKFPNKGGYKSWGNPKDDIKRQPREETPEQKARREEQERQQQEMIAKHEEYLQSIEKTNMEVRVQLEDEKIEKINKVEEDISKFSKQEKQQHKNDKKQKKTKIDIF